MAGTLKVKIQEDIILDNQDYGSKRVLEISSIADVFKRIISVPPTDTMVTIFNSAVSGGGSTNTAVDTENVRYLRITNLDSSNDVNIAIIGTADNFQVLLEAGKSFMMGKIDDSMDAVTGSVAPLFNALQDVDAIKVDTGASNTVQIEIFVASV